MASDPLALPDDLATALAMADDRIGIFAKQLLWYADVGSTNDVAAALANRGEPEGTVVVADAQSAGRGRHGRAWASPPGAGLYMSALMRPAAHAVGLLTIAAGVALSDGIQAATGLQPQLKWPNDVYLGGRKLAGILAEAGTSAADVQYVVLGCGVNLMPAAYPPDVAARATSIESELGRPVDRGLLLVQCLSALHVRYRDLQSKSSASVIARWRELALSTFGRRVEWDVAGVTRSGIAEDIDETGALLVRDGTSRARVISGEVRWLP
jgi:BirA family transcriptional regulator, biotin operon repressor / biotin---[acetyl-CoA-carboxylase] ligase